MKTKWLISLFIIAITIVIIIIKTEFISTSSDNPSLIIQTPDHVVPDFSFSLADSKTFTNQNLLEHWTLLFIGYTFCPDVCQITLSSLNRVYPELSKTPYNNIQVVFVSVDPNRDKVNNLSEYVHYFNANFIGTTSSHERLFPFLIDLGLLYNVVDEKHADANDAYYLVDHSASLVLINPQGEHHATFKATTNEDGIANVDVDLMVQDIHRIIQMAL